MENEKVFAMPFSKDKLVDELAKGKEMEKILRKQIIIYCSVA